MKTILVPLESHDHTHAGLAAALMLAQRFDSYVEGFALRFRVNEFIAVDMAGAIPLETLREESLDEGRRARTTFEAFMTERGVPRSSNAGSGPSWGWREDAPEGEDFVGSYGRVFDLIVMSRSDTGSGSLHERAVESGLFDSGRPVLIAGPGSVPRVATNVMVHWNGSTEQARATALAMPLLRHAERITVLRVEGGQGVPGPSAVDATRQLQCHGLPARLMTVPLNGRTTGEAVLAAAETVGSDLLVKGAYTQSRLRQMIFGGATRHILANATLPVLMAN